MTKDKAKKTLDATVAALSATPFPAMQIDRPGALALVAALRWALDEIERAAEVEREECIMECEAEAKDAHDGCAIRCAARIQARSTTRGER